MMIISVEGCDYCFFVKQKTAYEMRISDWSSDVCSSDLIEPDARRRGLLRLSCRTTNHDRNEPGGNPPAGPERGRADQAGHGGDQGQGSAPPLRRAAQHRGQIGRAHV